MPRQLTEIARDARGVILKKGYKAYSFLSVDYHIATAQVYAATCVTANKHSLPLHCTLASRNGRRHCNHMIPASTGRGPHFARARAAFRREITQWSLPTAAHLCQSSRAARAHQRVCIHLVPASSCGEWSHTRPRLNGEGGECN